MIKIARIVKVGILVWGVVGCAGESSNKKSATSSKGRSSGKTTNTDSGSPREGIDFRALDFVPYMIDGDSIPSGKAVLVEAGYFDVRQTGASDDTGNIRDYRRATVAAWGGNGAPAALKTKGCAEGTLFPSASKNDLSAASVEGFYKGSLLKDGNQYKVSGEADSGDYDLSAALTFKGTLSAAAVAVEDQKVPARGSLSLSKALYSVFGTHMDLADLNDTLASTKRELVLTEDSEGDPSFNTVIVTAYGSGDTYVRCLFGPGESATLTNAQLKTLLPLRALTAVFSRAVLIKDGEVPIWVATFGGVGIEDLSVP